MKSLLSMAAFFFSMNMVEAQNSNPYWVIETNIHNPTFTILRVYDSQNALLHEETLKGKALNILSRKDRRRIGKKVKGVLKHPAFVSNRN